MAESNCFVGLKMFRGYYGQTEHLQTCLYFPLNYSGCTKVNLLPFRHTLCFVILGLWFRDFILEDPASYGDVSWRGQFYKYDVGYVFPNNFQYRHLAE